MDVRSLPLIRGIGSEEQVCVLGLEEDTLKQMVCVVPPLEVPLDFGSPRENNRLICKRPTEGRAPTEETASEDDPPEQEGKERRADPEDCARQPRLAACRTEIR